MKIIFKIAILCLLALVFDATALPGADWQIASAQDDSRPQRKKRKPLQTLSEPAMRQVERAQAALDEDDYEEARERLDSMAKLRRLNDYERAIMYNYYAILAFELDDTPGAISAFESMLLQVDAPDGILSQARYNLSQLYFGEEQYRKSLDMLDEWFSLQEEDPGVGPYNFKAQAHYQLGEFREAIAPLRTVIRKTEELGGPIKENWYIILRSIYFELEDNPELLKIMEILVLNYPKPQYWLQLSGIYAGMDNEAKQLGTLQVAYMEDAFNRENHYQTLAQLLLLNDVPYSAARVIGKAIEDGNVEKDEKNYSLLAQSLVQAKEFDDAIEPMTIAADFSEKGQLSIRLAGIFMERDRWDDCVTAVKAGLRKGKVDRPDQAHIMMGTCYFNADDLDNAIKEMREAQKDKRSATASGAWINYLVKERARRKQLAAMAR